MFKDKQHRTNLILIFLFLIIVILSLYFSNILKKNCGEDKACFNDALKRCSGAVLTSVSGGNIYIYESYSSFTDECNLKITMAKATPGSELNLRASLEGKSMKCIIQRSRLQEQTFSDMDDLAEMCTGQLKEAMYEMIVQRMYSLVIANLGNISLEARKAAAGV